MSELAVLRGWLISDVFKALERDFPGRPAYIWDRRGPLTVNPKGATPVVVTVDPTDHDLARLAGADVAHIPAMLGLPAPILDASGKALEWDEVRKTWWLVP